MIIGGVARLEVVTLDELNTVRHRTRRDQERNHERERVEIEPQQRDDTKAPGRGNQYTDQWQHDAVNPGAEVGQQEHEQDRNGQEEDLQNLVEIAVDPAHQDRLTGSVDMHSRHGFGLAQFLDIIFQLTELAEYFDVIKLTLIECRFDQRRAQVG